MNESSIILQLSSAEIRSLLRIVRMKQDEYKKVTCEFPMYEKFKSLDYKLEALKMKMVNQLSKGELV